YTSEASNGIEDDFARSVREVQAEGVLATTVRMERLSWHERDLLLLDRDGQQSSRVHALWQLDPDEHPPTRPGDTSAGGEVTLDGRQHGVAALGVHGPKPLQMCGQHP